MYVGPFGVPTEEDQRQGIHYIAISDFQGTPAWLKYVFHTYVCRALSSDNRMVCFRRKAFLKSDSGWINKKISFILMYYTCDFMKVKYL